MALTREDLHGIAMLIQPICGQLDGLEAGMKADAAEWKTDISDIKTRISDLETGMTDVKAEVSVLGADVADVKAGMSKLEAGVAKLETDMAGLKRKLFEVEIRVSATYDFALEAWAKSVENRKWLEQAKS